MRQHSLVDNPTDPSVWAQGIRELLDDEEQRAALASAGLKRALRFSWHRTATQMLKIYTDEIRR